MADKRAFGQKTSVPLSPALRCGHVLYVSGQVPTDADGVTPEGIEAQTRATLDKVRDLVVEAGGSLDDVVKTTVFLKRVEDFAVMNRVYAEYFGDVPPARSSIRCDLMIDILVEIEAIAHYG